MANEVVRETPVQILMGELVKYAIRGETTTYGELAVLIGLPRSGCYMSNQMAGHLLVILNWCLDRGLPPLTSIVVKSGTSEQAGLPGNGFWDAMGLEGSSTAQRRSILRIYHQSVFGYYRGLRT